METFLQLLASGIALGAVYGMVALGFVIVFKSTGVLNFAHGEFLMLGSFLALTFIVQWSVHPIIAVAAIAMIVAVLGVALHYGIMKPLVGQPLFSVILVTIGIAIVIRAFLLITYGPIERGRITALPQGRLDVGVVVIPYVDLIMFGVAVAAVAILFVFFAKTRIGLQMRAVAENLEAAAAMGVSPNKVFAISWGLGALLAGTAGVLYAHFTAVIDLNLGAIGLRAFPAAMIGGLDSIEGAILGGMVVGITEQLAAGYFGGEYRDFVAFGLMFIVLMVRPFGFFGTRELVRV